MLGKPFLRQRLLGSAIPHLRVDVLIIQVNDVHLLADALQGRLRAQGRHVGTDVAVRVTGNHLRGG